MSRNLDSRVEVVTPVEAPALQARLKFVLDTQLHDAGAPGTCRRTAPVRSGRSRCERCKQPGGPDRRRRAAELRSQSPAQASTRIIPRRPYG